MDSPKFLEIARILLTIGGALITVIHFFITPLEHQLNNLETSLTMRVEKNEDNILNLQKVSGTISPIDLQQTTEIANIKQNVAVLQDDITRSNQRIDVFADEIKNNDITKIDKTDFNHYYNYLLKRVDNLYCPCYDRKVP